MTSIPGSALFQTTQGVSAPPAKGVPQRAVPFASALRAAEVPNGVQQADSAQKVPASNPSDKPRPDTPRGTLLDIKV